MSLAERSVLGFRVGSSRLAIAADLITEVTRMPSITRVPHAPASLAGIANLRGAVAPIISLGKLIGQAASGEASVARLLVLDLETPVGLMVDAVLGLSQATGDGRGGALYLHGEDAVTQIDLLELLKTPFAGLAKPKVETTSRVGLAAEAVPSGDRTLGLLTFELAGQVYALPLDQIREVVRAPDRVVTLPQEGEADLGVITLAGRIIPLVSLRSLLGFARGGLVGARVLVVHIGDAVAGLVVDRLHAIVRVPEAAVSPIPAVLNRGRGEAMIQALCRIDGDRGLVSVLDPERLFSREAMERILNSGQTQEGPMGDSASSGDRQAFVVFTLGDEEFALPIGAVDEVVTLPERLTRVPKTPPFVEGVMNLRGRVVPVIDQRKRFDVVGDAPGARRVIITPLKDAQVGFIVDKVSEILTLAPGQISAAPQLSGDGARIFDRVGHPDDANRIVLLVDPKALLDRAESDLVAAMSQAAKPQAARSKAAKTPS